MPIFFKKKSTEVAQESIESTESPAVADSQNTTIIETTGTTEENGNVKDLKHRLENLEIVNELGQFVTSSLNLNSIFDHLYKTINSMMDAAILELSVYNPGNGEHKILSNIKNADNLEQPVYSNLMAEWCLENEKEIILADAENEFGRYVFKPLTTSEGKPAVSVMAFPIVSKEKKRGSITVISYRNNAFDNYHAEMIRSLIPYTAVAIENAAIHQEIIEIQNQIINEKKEVEKQREEAIRQFNRSEELLLNILPAEIAEELKSTGRSEAKSHNEVSVLFTDFHNFTQATEKLTAHELVDEIHYTYSEFDKIISKHGIEKIKTIGDSYMCASGIPVASESHAVNIVNAALELVEFVKANKTIKSAEGKPYFELRIGVHSGPVIAGIVGIKKFAYDIWGDTVNTASRLESSGEVGKVNISGATYELIKNHFNCTYRGKVEAKNKGAIDMYFVDSQKQ